MKFCETCKELEFNCETETGDSYRCRKCGRAFMCHKSGLKIAVLKTAKEKGK